VRTTPGQGVSNFDCTRSSDPASLAAAGYEALLVAVPDIFRACRRLLRPGGVDRGLPPRCWRRSSGGSSLGQPGGASSALPEL